MKSSQGAKAIQSIQESGDYGDAPITLPPALSFFSEISPLYPSSSSPSQSNNRTSEINKRRKITAVDPFSREDAFHEVRWNELPNPQESSSTSGLLSLSLSEDALADMTSSIGPSGTRTPPPESSPLLMETASIQTPRITISNPDYLQTRGHREEDQVTEDQRLAHQVNYDEVSSTSDQIRLAREDFERLKKATEELRAQETEHLILIGNLKQLAGYVNCEDTPGKPSCWARQQNHDARIHRLDRLSQMIRERDDRFHKSHEALNSLMAQRKHDGSKYMDTRCALADLYRELLALLPMKAECQMSIGHIFFLDTLIEYLDSLKEGDREDAITFREVKGFLLRCLFPNLFSDEILFGDIPPVERKGDDEDSMAEYQKALERKDSLKREALWRKTGVWVKERPSKLKNFPQSKPDPPLGNRLAVSEDMIK